MQYLSTPEFLSVAKTVPLVDVRSPGEYVDGHISTAKNIPLFDDDERAVVGIEYKHKGRTTAIEKGLEIAGPKMRDMTKVAKSLAIDHTLALYCWRGGMRSEKMAWLFELVGLKTYVLKGGYKSFRKTLFEDMRHIEKLQVLQGPTGSGKTDILHELEAAGEQVIDLEKLANHRGSAFGALGLGAQPTTQQFQNDLYHQFRKLDNKRRIWIESESLTIGRVYLPESLWDNMNDSRVVEINMDRKLRADRLVEEYGQFDKELLKASILKISSRFGGNRVKEAIELLEKNDLHAVAMLLLEYYDKSYDFSRRKYKQPSAAVLDADSADPKINAQILIELADHINS